MFRIFKLFFITSLFAFFSSCSETDNSEVSQEEQTIEETDNHTDEESSDEMDDQQSSELRLSRLTTSSENSNITVEFVYAENKLTNLFINSTEGEERLIYENDLPVKVERYSNGTLTSFSDLEYENGIFKRERNFTNDINTFYTEYTFQNDNLVKVERFSKNQFEEWISTFSREFEYDNEGNVQLVVQTDIISANTQITEFNYTYDTNKHYMSGLPEVVRFFFWDDSISLSKNNFISETITINGRTASHETFEYTYNTAEFPIMRQEFDSEGELVRTTAYVYE